MRKLIKKIFVFVLLLGTVFALLRWGPYLKSLILGEESVAWVTQQFSENVRSKNELVVFEAEIKAQETITQEAWLIGTVQKILIPYTFTIRFSIDLSKIQTAVEGNIVTISIPAPQAKYQQLHVDEEGVKKHDWLYPVSAERYADIIDELENRLITKYSRYDPYISAAWEGAVTQLQNLFFSFAHQHVDTNSIRIHFVQLSNE